MIYSYNITGQTVNPGSLSQEIENDVGMNTSIVSITMNGSSLNIEFVNTLSIAEQNSLNNIVSSHNGSPNDNINEDFQIDGADVIQTIINFIGFNTTVDGDVLNISSNLNSTGLCEIIQPIVTSQAVTISQNITTNITIYGENFTQSTTVTSSNGLIINSVTYVSNSQIVLNVTTPSVDQTHDLTIDNQLCSITINGFITTQLSTWIDLSTSGTGNDPDVQSAMTVGRDADGMFFNGTNPWSSWVKFSDDTWSRGANNTLQWIFTRPTAAMMIGIGSTSTNETSTAQYYQGEVMIYISSSTNVWGFFGNSGSPGNAGNFSNTANISGGSGVYKLVFENDGGVGSNVTLYEIPSIAQQDWDNTSNVIFTTTIAGSLNPQQANIMPFIIPRSASTQRFVAYKIGA